MMWKIVLRPGRLRFLHSVHNVRISAFLAALIHNLRFGARTLARARGYTVIACLTLALGIGASIAMFTVMRSILWRALPYRTTIDSSSSRQTRAAFAMPRSSRRTSRSARAKPDAGADRQRQRRRCPRRGRRSGGTHGRSERQRRLSAVAWPESGTRPPLRGAPRCRRGPVRSVIISDALWRRRFGANPGVGRRVMINVNNGPREVIGVLPPDIKMFMPGSVGMAEDTDVWFPTDISAARDGRGAVALAHLKRGRHAGRCAARTGRTRVAVRRRASGDYRDEPVRFRVREIRAADEGRSTRASRRSPLPLPSSCSSGASMSPT